MITEMNRATSMVVLIMVALNGLFLFGNGLFMLVATYEPLWAWLGGTYTLHGGLMVVGGLMFGLWALRAWWR